jgi:hypothetical protein
MPIHFRRIATIADYLPTAAFLLIAVGWFSMILLHHNPTSSLAWALTFWANRLLQEVFYFFSNLHGVSVVGHMIIALVGAALSIAAVRRNWRGCEFITSHFALILMIMPLVGQSARLSGPPGDPDLHFLYRIAENLSPISVILALGLLASCLVCHYRVVRRVWRERALRRRLWMVEIGW